jgi:hypothetical protein
VANSNSNTVSVLLGNGNGTFLTSRSVAIAFSRAAAAADINRDGLPDVVMINGTSEISVLLGLRNAATHLQITAPSVVTVGSAFTLTVTALTADNKVDLLYMDKIHFTSRDPSAMLPGNYTFSKADGGSQTFTVTLNTAGTQTITATDTAHSSIKGKVTITVNSGSAAPPRASGCSSAAASTVIADPAAVAGILRAEGPASLRVTDAGAYWLSVAAGRADASTPRGTAPGTAALAIDPALEITIEGRPTHLPAVDEKPAAMRLRLAEVWTYFASADVPAEAG